MAEYQEVSRISRSEKGYLMKHFGNGGTVHCRVASCRSLSRSSCFFIFLAGETGLHPWCSTLDTWVKSELCLCKLANRKTCIFCGSKAVLFEHTRSGWKAYLIWGVILSSCFFTGWFSLSHLLNGFQLNPRSLYWYIHLPGPSLCYF